MDRSVLSVLLWIAAALVLLLYLARRRKRKFLR